ncbi:hypothetical protein CmeUKMEL1_10305 [Cryptosporidium meleagridis]|uniref:Uncharacterized protein n=1 Tax=Cryptosporidium meleagridis TaxID=93969 RepID=A0A2P4Z220_9CRYT|nr:hypothetical protein CmeUKMEL1_10305 [Cryptosporidium meleagridis]
MEEQERNGPTVNGDQSVSRPYAAISVSAMPQNQNRPLQSFVPVPKGENNGLSIREVQTSTNTSMAEDNTQLLPINHSFSKNTDYVPVVSKLNATVSINNSNSATNTNANPINFKSNIATGNTELSGNSNNCSGNTQNGTSNLDLYQAAQQIQTGNQTKPMIAAATTTAY